MKCNKCKFDHGAGQNEMFKIWIGKNKFTCDEYSSLICKIMLKIDEAWEEIKYATHKNTHGFIISHEIAENKVGISTKQNGSINGNEQIEIAEKALELFLNSASNLVQSTCDIFDYAKDLGAIKYETYLQLKNSITQCINCLDYIKLLRENNAKELNKIQIEYAALQDDSIGVQNLKNELLATMQRLKNLSEAKTSLWDARIHSTIETLQYFCDICLKSHPNWARKIH